jgi:hypothetical protein
MLKRIISPETKMIELNSVIEFIDKAANTAGNYWTYYIVQQLKNQFTLSIILEIMNQSGKTPSEAVLVLLSTFRYISKDSSIFSKLEKDNSFQIFLKDNLKEILKVSVERKVQANLPERGLPILEILGKHWPSSSIAIIELGASYGLIGDCLLNPHRMLQEKSHYFSSGQQIPENPKGIDFYLGIDIDPPERDWLISCCADEKDAARIGKIQNDFNRLDNFNLIKASAFGFTGLKEVKALSNENFKLIVLTSFMLYQYNREKQDRLKGEIMEFTKSTNGHWLRQEVELARLKQNDYYIELDNHKIIALSDDKCTAWKWI